MDRWPPNKRLTRLSGPWSKEKWMGKRFWHKKLSSLHKAIIFYFKFLPFIEIILLLKAPNKKRFGGGRIYISNRKIPVKTKKNCSVLKSRLCSDDTVY